MVNTIKNFTSNKLYVQIAICAVALILMPLLLIKVNHSSKDLTVQRQQLAQLQSDLDALDQLQADRQNSATQLDTIMASLPNSYRDVADYTIQLENLTQTKRQVLETTIDQSSAKEKNSLRSLKYTIQTQGTYTTFTELINELAILPYHTHIDAITIDDNSGPLQTLTTYKIYLLKE